MKKTLLTILTFVVTITAFAQDLPTNPEPGKCYVRCVTPDVWVNQDVTIQVSPAYKKLSTVPAKFTTATEEVVVENASQRLEVVPAVYETQTFEVVVKEASQRLEKIPSRTETVTETVVVKEASQRLELVPAVYETQEFTVVTQEASQRLEIVPAVYETQDFTVVTKEASQRLEVVPAEYGTETRSYKKREYGTSIKVVPASFSSNYQVVEVKPASARWEMSDTPAADCASSDPNDCRYWCYKSIPAQNITVNTTELAADASYVRTPDCDPATSGDDCGMGTYTVKVVSKPASTRVIDIPAETKTEKRVVMVSPPTTRVIDVPQKTKTMKRVVMVQPPTTRVIEIPAETETVTRTVIIPESTRVVEIPAETKTLKRTVMVTPPTTRVIDIPQKTSTIKKTILTEDSKVVETIVPAVTKTVTKEVLQTKGGLTTWKEVDCKLVEYNDLNINWNLGSATLTAAAKAEIDAKLLPVLADGVSVEIASHTDSRGTKESNLALSERRAQAVTNYLISKGINSSRIVSNGYGETRLLNRCADGVSCTEREHLVNRRTQFRVINQ
ncbi:OmpA family protein [Oceanihabitans sediminis]|uniref:OmpA family protein n=1 Tax=Oceanihabitans sediminis TaxID=1812012 RepID=A0A368P528_9FLAO|nr:OmpA family protein [Oceanihabitans sediminis]MDX1277534.1 OmpA family protein [Oceanihabitans sediminis]MDX1773431.1 OmpA family protein [Oceanihabitans sediminis]RBP32886.1 OmpA family protein [Oceanihabitans sediminis]RCU57588.1 OmpA family protein [Oceanihabitans sediminis]